MISFSFLFNNANQGLKIDCIFVPLGTSPDSYREVEKVLSLCLRVVETACSILD
jgi:hypothetical protein